MRPPSVEWWQSINSYTLEFCRIQLQSALHSFVLNENNQFSRFRASKHIDAHDGKYPTLKYDIINIKMYKHCRLWTHKKTFLHAQLGSSFRVFFSSQIIAKIYNARIMKQRLHCVCMGKYMMRYRMERQKHRVENAEKCVLTFVISPFYIAYSYLLHP